jgi:hypothetical protein
MASKSPAKGKAKVKVTSTGKKVSYGQAGKAKDGGPRVKPGTSKATVTVLDLLVSRSNCQKKNRTTQTHQTIFLVSAGNALALSLSEVSYAN